MRTKHLVTMVFAAGAVALAACGGGSDDAAPEVADPPVATTAQPAGPAPVVVTAKETALGTTLVGPDGLTLYAFTNDIDAQSTCYGTCAEAWPPVLVDPDWTVGPGLDSGVFSTAIREDGTEQLVAGKFPLYSFAGDAVPGDVNGQGSGDVWFAVGTDAKLIEEAAGDAAAPTTTVPAPPAAPAAPVAPEPDLGFAETPLGAIVVDGEGRTLYAFTKDANGSPTCVDGCATAWPPIVLDGEPVAAGIDTQLVTTVERPDGGSQLKVGKWPVYHFAGDEQPGDVNGQGSGGVWFVIAPDGKLIKA